MRSTSLSGLAGLVIGLCVGLLLAATAVHGDYAHDTSPNVVAMAHFAANTSTTSLANTHTDAAGSGRSRPQAATGVVRLVSSSDSAAKGARSGAELLTDAAEQVGRGEMTGAGRALAKHGGREGSAFPAPTGSAHAINAQARGIVQDILNNEYRRVSFFNRRLGSQVVDIYDRSGRGLRYSQEGDFIGFLEPPR